MPGPLTTSRLASLRPAGAASLALAAMTVLAACSTSDPSPTPRTTPVAAAPTDSSTPAATPEPTPTPAPTPRFTNEPDDELAARLHALDDRAVADLGRITSLRAASTIIAGYRTLAADGARRTRRSPRSPGRRTAHVVGVANAYDELVTGIGRPRIGRKEAVTALRDDPSTWRTDVLEALAAIVNERRDPGRRRRGSDASATEARGAA